MNSRRTVCIRGAGLEETMPVDGGCLVHGVVVEVVDDVKLEVVPLKKIA